MCLLCVLGLFSACDKLWLLQAASTREMYDSWRAGKATLLAVVYAYMMSCVGEALEVSPGEEFRVALREAQQASQYLPKATALAFHCPTTAALAGLDCLHFWTRASPCKLHSLAIQHLRRPLCSGAVTMVPG